MIPASGTACSPPWQSLDAGVRATHRWDLKGPRTWMMKTRAPWRPLAVWNTKVLIGSIRRPARNIREYVSARCGSPAIFLAPQSRERLEDGFPTLPLDRFKPFGVSETGEYVYASAPRQARDGGQPKRPSPSPCQSFATEAAGMDDRLPGIDNTVKSQEYRLGRVLEYVDLQVGERSKVRFLP